MSLQIKPRAYQEKILGQLAYLDSCGLFMGTGSGKTFTSLFKTMDFPTHNLLVITPSRVVPQWINSINTIFPDYHIIDLGKGNANSKNDKLLSLDLSEHKNNVLIVNIEVIRSLTNLPSIINNDWAIILDESHKIKDLGTKKSPVKWTIATLQVGAKTKYKIILTATPTQKELGGYIDYYTQLRFLGYLNYSDQVFRQRYCIMKKKQIVGMPYPINVIVGYKNIHEIEDLLKKVTVRYIPTFTEQEPEHIKITVPKVRSYAKLERERCYEDLELRSLTARRIAKKTLTGGKILGREIFGEPRTYEDNTNKIDWLRDFLEDTEGRVLIFYKYNVEKDMLLKLCKELNKKVITVNGETKNKYDTVNNQEWDICLGQVNACGESIDGFQYKTHICIYYSMPESSIEYIQSLGRINRDGQKYAPVYYFLIMKNTIDEQIWDMIQKKVEFSEEVLNKLELEESV